MLAVAPFFAGQTQRNTLFLNGNIMQLHYKTDHTSCLNYKTESFGGFTWENVGRQTVQQPEGAC